MRKLLFLFPITLVMATVMSCSGKGDRHTVDSVEFDGSASASAPAPAPSSTSATSATSVTSDTSAPSNVRSRSIGNLREVFNDSNYVHWASAEQVGIKPLGDCRSHWRPSRPLWRIRTCEDFVVDELTYSVPYLVPEAYNAVHEIGRRFRDSVRTRGGGDYRMIVTSVLRTPDAVRRLRRVNRNAIDSSVHQLATTVDISYAKFMGSPEPTAQTVGELKGVLSEVLAAMRSEGKIWVKYEYHQPCFHLTCRPVGNKQ